MKAEVYTVIAMAARWNGDSPCTPILGKPKKQKMKINVSGVLRKRLTYTAPAARSTGTGETRIAVSTAPPPRHSTATTTDRLIVLRNALTNSWELSDSVSRNMSAVAGRARAHGPGRR